MLDNSKKNKESFQNITSRNVGLVRLILLFLNIMAFYYYYKYQEGRSFIGGFFLNILMYFLMGSCFISFLADGQY